MGGVEVVDRAALPEGGQRAASCRAEHHAAHLFLQHWFNLSDPAAEEALYDSPALLRFAGVDLGVAAAPDETTILRFRHLLEEHELCGQILDTVNLYLASKGGRRSGESVGESSKLTSTVSTLRFIGGN